MLTSSKSVLVFFLLTLCCNVNASIFPKQFSLKFEQVIKSEVSGKEKRSYGRLDFSSPKNLRIEIDRPDKIIFVRNAKTVWYYTAPFVDGEPGELTINTSDKKGISGFFDLLTYGFSDNAGYQSKEIDNGLGHQLIFSDKKKKEIGLSEAKFTFSDKGKLFSQITSITLLHDDGKKVLLNISSIQENTSFPERHFIFEAPPNTRIGQ